MNGTRKEILAARPFKIQNILAQNHSITRNFWHPFCFIPFKFWTWKVGCRNLFKKIIVFSVIELVLNTFAENFHQCHIPPLSPSLSYLFNQLRINRLNHSSAKTKIMSLCYNCFCNYFRGVSTAAVCTFISVWSM